MTTRVEAQKRVDQIQAFRRELDLLRANGHLQLSAEQNQAVDDYHSALSRELAATFDIDSDLRAKQLSLGMRIASFLGALSLAASVFFLFYRFWGELSVVSQVSILVAAPLLTFGFAVWLRARDFAGYFTKLAASVCFCCFILDVTMLGQIFNITPSPNAFLAWAVFAMILAYGMNTRLLLVAAILCMVIYLTARIGAWAGGYWADFTDRPENFLVSAASLLLASHFIDHRRFDGFAATYRVSGLLTVFVPLLVLSHWGEGSYLLFDEALIEGGYQILSFILAGLAIWLGIRRGLPDVVNTSVTFFIMMLYTKFYDWWWDIMPKYLFFLVGGLVAILLLLVLRRLRGLRPLAVTGGVS